MDNIKITNQSTSFVEDREKTWLLVLRFFFKFRPSQTKLKLNHISFFTTVNMALVQKEKKKNQDIERQAFILRPLRSTINLFR